ncbi:MAG TPA: A24 family peptidase [Micromonosporaceae bacterium]|nr:A24 family peptidase [Micromonosporaceae bacterium]
MADVAAAGVLAAGWVRAQVFIHGVAPQQPWRTVCPHCQHPVITSRLAYAWSPRSRCPHCRDRIGPRAAIVEATTGGAAALLAWTATDPLVLVAFLVFAFAGTALAFVDLAVHRLPDRLTLPVFTAVATLLAVDAIWHHRLANGVGAIAGAAASAAFYLLLAIIAGGGAGDIKLALGTGLVLGWHGWATIPIGMLLGFALTSLCAAAMVLTGRLKRGDHIAHGPGMLAAVLAVTIVPGL